MAAALGSDRSRSVLPPATHRNYFGSPPAPLDQSAVLEFRFAQDVEDRPGPNPRGRILGYQRCAIFSDDFVGDLVAVNLRQLLGEQPPSCVDHHSLRLWINRGIVGSLQQS